MKRFQLLLLACSVLMTANCGRRSDGDRRELGEAWLVNYLGDQRVGYSMFRSRPVADGYVFDGYIRLRLAMGGKPQEIQSRSSVRTGKDLTMREFDFSFGSAERAFGAKGRVEEGKLVISQAGQRSREIKLQGPVFPMAAIGRLVSQASLKKDSLFRIPVFDVSVLDVTPAEIRVLGREKITVNGENYNAIKYSTQMAKLTMTTWVDQNGMILREESPPRMRSERVRPEDVLVGESEDGRVDILRMFAVPVDTTVPAAGTVRYARIELIGIEADEYALEGGNQRVVSKSPLIVEVNTPELPATPVVLPVSGGDEFLVPTVSLQCDDSNVKAKAAELVGKTKDAVETVRKLADWVFVALDKQPTASYPTAADVLASRRGDCNEHSVLLAALCRAAGVPAKVVVGLVYMDGAFYYHAWNEVLLNRWVPVDATFGEFPASALRLRLAEGELAKQAEILGLVGRLQMRLLQFK